MGTIFLQEQFKGTVNSVETYLRTYMLNRYKLTGAGLHYGTWESAVYGLAHAGELRGIRTKLFPTRTPRFVPQLKDRPVIHKSEVIGNRWCIPFPGSDRSVVMRSQRHFFDQDKKRPVQMRAYVAFNSILHIFGIIFVAAIFALMARFSFGRKLLLAHPKLFSFGFASHEGPEEATNENTNFEMTFFGQGWKETRDDPSAEFDGPMDKTMTVRVVGNNPGYGATCVALLLTATTILKDSQKMPSTGGVFPPGAAFKNTSLISELQKNGFTFEVVAPSS